MDWQGLAVLITSLGTIITTIITAWLKYNQNKHDKMTDLKIDQFKKDETRRSKVRSDNVSTIYGQLWFILHELKADRVYIVQPHPLTHSMYLTISVEVLRNGVVGMKKSIQRLDIASVAVFAADLAKRDYMQYLDVKEDVRDKKAKSLLSLQGTKSAFIKRLSDPAHDWVGSIFAEYQEAPQVDSMYIKKILFDSADLIQFILPPIEDNYEDK